MVSAQRLADAREQRWCFVCERPADAHVPEIETIRHGQPAITRPDGCVMAGRWRGTIPRKFDRSIALAGLAPAGVERRLDQIVAPQFAQRMRPRAIGRDPAPVEAGLRDQEIVE